MATTIGIPAAAGMTATGCRDKTNNNAHSFGGELHQPGQSLGHRFRDQGFPPPSTEISVETLIVGGGIAGLAAGRALQRLGRDSFAILELDNAPGGNSSHGHNAVSEFPWGAHYLPLPGPAAVEVLEFLRETGIVTGEDSAGHPVYREEFLCHDPMERLFIRGAWQEGLVPRAGVLESDAAEIQRFLQEMESFSLRRGSDGRPWFEIPVDRSSDATEARALDRMTFAEWLDANRYTCEPLRTHLDYCCRDDFGAGTRHVSAWAGVHYFAARGGKAVNGIGNTVLTWPEGNGRLVKHLLTNISEKIRTRTAVHAVNVHGDDSVDVSAWDDREQRSIRWKCRRLLLAVPQHVRRRLMPGTTRSHPESFPWVVANVTLSARPDEAGMEMCWDNVFHGSPSLGYVDATHQSLLPVRKETVLTWYAALDHLPAREARIEAAGRTWSDWVNRVIGDLKLAHPGIVPLIQRLDVRVLGHGMVCPTPGRIWNGERTRDATRQGPVHFAHSDLSGISLFEEAYTRGHQAAHAIHRSLQAVATHPAGGNSILPDAVGVTHPIA